MDRRQFLTGTSLTTAAMALAWLGADNGKAAQVRRPNILFAIADDQSAAHTSIGGDPVVETPNFDRIATEGVRFTNAYCSSPSCTPSRGAILTGQHIWRLGQGGSLWSALPSEHAVYPDLLEAAGYHVGFARKGWGPGSHEASGWPRNPAGDRYDGLGDFLEDRPRDAPFCFWFGSHEPHRPYERGSGVDSGMDPGAVRVPAMLPDAPEVRSDICDYLLECQTFDRQVGAMLDLLEDRGELDNTLIVMTSDNGMPFPRAKANLYDWGTRMPMAVRWGEAVSPGRVVDDYVDLADVAPTFLEVAGLEPTEHMTARSLAGILTGEGEGRIDPLRDRIYLGRERHAWVREGNLGYPCRALRSDEYLYIRNFEPDRWPAGDPPGYGDIDGGPTKAYLLEHRDDPEVAPLFELACAKRPAEELYHLPSDPEQMNNVAGDPAYAQARDGLWGQLERYLAETGDPRAEGGGDIFETDEYFGRPHV
jgi:arylsulfatase A-like enzyme